MSRSFEMKWATSPSAFPTGRDGLFHDARFASLFPVHDHAVEGFAAANGAPQVPVKLRALLSGLQDPRSLSHRFRPRVAGQLLKSRIHILDGAASVGDHNQVGGLFDRAVQRAEHVFGLADSLLCRTKPVAGLHSPVEPVVRSAELAGLRFVRFLLRLSCFHLPLRQLIHRKAGTSTPPK